MATWGMARGQTEKQKDCILGNGTYFCGCVIFFSLWSYLTVHVESKKADGWMNLGLESQRTYKRQMAKAL